MNKTLTTITLAIVLTFGATFANAGIIISEKPEGTCKNGIIISEAPTGGIIISEAPTGGSIISDIAREIAGIIISEKPATCTEKDGIIISEAPTGGIIISE